MEIAVIDVLARALGKRYTTFDVVGAGPRIIAGIASEYGSVDLYPYEKAIKSTEEISKRDIVLISAMSSDHKALSTLIYKLRKLNRSLKIIVGGPISFEYTRILRELPVDLVVVGEAEIPLRQLLYRYVIGDYEYRSIPALAYVENDVVKLTSSHIHTPKQILDDIKPWTLVDRSYDYPQIYRFYVEVVRGCSNYRRPMINLGELSCIECHRCISPILEERLNCPVNIPPGCGFCSVPYMFGHPRSRSIRSIYREISELVEHGARRIVLSGPDILDYGREELVKGPLTDPCKPPANIEAIESLFNELYSIEEIKNNKVVIMVENIKACLVNKEVGKLFERYLKNTTIHIGLETGCDWFNEKILGKPITLRQVLSACKILRDHSLRPYVYIMYGLPSSTREVYEETIKSIEELSRIGVEKITLYKYINLPATAFHKLPPDVEAFKELITRLRDIVDKYNLVAKRKLLYEKIEVYLYEDRGRIYGYPVRHGPVVFVEKTRRGDLSGCRGVVKITDIGTRFVKGVLINVLEC